MVEDALKVAEPKTAKPNHKQPDTKKTSAEKAKKNIPRTEKSDIDKPRRKPVSSALDALLHPHSSAREVHSQAKILASHLSSDRIMTRSDCEDPAEARCSPMTSSDQDNHTTKKAASVCDADLTSPPMQRPKKRKASPASDKPKEAKRARVEKDQSNEKSEKHSGTKTATDPCSPEASSSRPTVGCAGAGHSNESVNATPHLKVSSTNTRPTSRAVDNAEGGRNKADNRTKGLSTSLSSKTTRTKTAPGGANSNDKTQVNTTPTTGSSSSKQASATVAQKSTQSIKSKEKAPAHQKSSSKPSLVDRDGNTKGSKRGQETRSISISKELPNFSHPVRGCSTEGGSQAEAEANGSGAAELGRDDQEVNDILNHQGPSGISLFEPVRGGADGMDEDEAALTDFGMGEEGLDSEMSRDDQGVNDISNYQGPSEISLFEPVRGGVDGMTEDEAAVADVEMDESGLDDKLQTEPDQEPDKRLVALFGIAVGAGAAAVQFFGA